MLQMKFGTSYKSLLIQIKEKYNKLYKSLKFHFTTLFIINLRKAFKKYNYDKYFFIINGNSKILRN